MYIIKGDLIFSKDRDSLNCIKDGYIGVENGYIEFVDNQIPSEYKNISILDYSNKLIIPGFCDLHTHAPQFENIGLGMDKQLLPWLNNHTFPTEARYSDVDYAYKRYEYVVEKLIQSGTTRACIFGTIHKQSCQVLINLMQQKGIRGYVGKVNMDINSPEYLIEDSNASIQDTLDFYNSNKDNEDVKPIITPRFAPSCKEDTLAKLGEIVKEFNIPVQTHMDENLNEIKWVEELFPNYTTYADVYEKNNLLSNRTVMAHCIYLKDSELEVLNQRGVYIAHCPHSNANLASGIMPAKPYLEKGLKIGFGSDVSGGNEIGILKSMVLSLQLSKIRHHFYPDESTLSVNEAFYMATKSGGEFFGKVGTFENNYEFDALVIDDNDLTINNDLSLEQRLSRFVFAGDDRNIIKRYCFGKEVG